MRKGLRPAPRRRRSAVWLAPERVVGPVLRQLKHPRVGGPAGQCPSRLAGPGRAQRRQQPGDAPLLIRAEGHPGAGVAGQQRPERVAGPGRMQLLKQLGGALRILQADALGGARGQ